MKTKLDLASYGVQEMTIAEIQEVNAGLSDFARRVIETTSYIVHRALRPGNMPLNPTAEEIAAARHFATGSMIN